MKKIFLLTVIVGYLLSTTLSATDIGGRINSNTIFSIENSPYYLIGDIEVPEEVILTIDENVKIFGNNNAIKVWGTLNIEGNLEKVTLINTHIERGDNAEDCQINLTNINMEGGSLYRNSGSSGSYCSINTYDSVFKNIDYTYLWYPKDECHIERNIFINSGGISIGVNGPTIYIKNNIFINQITNYAVEVWANYSDSIIVEKNSFLSTDKIALNVKYDSGKFDASNNYWNTIDETMIDQMITDKKDDLSKVDVIEYQPILLEKDINTPDYRKYMDDINISLTSNNSIMETLLFDINIIPSIGTTITQKEYSFDNEIFTTFDSSTISKKFNYIGNHTLTIKTINSDNIETQNSISFEVKDISISNLKIIDQNFINSLGTGWHLVGTPFEIIDLSIFDNALIIWIFNSTTNSWEAYSSNSSYKTQIQNDSTIKLATKINAAAGIWVLK